MHPLHDYVAKQLADKLKSKKVVVWYDVRGEFAPFIAEVRGGARTTSEPMPVSVGGVAARARRVRGLDVRAARGRRAATSAGTRRRPSSSTCRAASATGAARC